jgi:hypothetical protein
VISNKIRIMFIVLPLFGHGTTPRICVSGV